MIHEDAQTEMKEELRVILVRKMKLFSKGKQSIDCHFLKERGIKPFIFKSICENI